MEEEKPISTSTLSEETKELLNSPIFKEFILDDPQITLTDPKLSPLSNNSNDKSPITHLAIDTSKTLKNKETTSPVKTPLSGLKPSATCSTLYDIENLEKEDIRSIEKYFHTYSEKLYISGLLYKRNDIQPDGKPFPSVSGPIWTKWWVELWGPVLKFWHVTDEIDYLKGNEKSSNKVKHIIQTELVPHPDVVKKIKENQETKYINISDSVVDLVNYDVGEEPPFPYNNFLSLSTAGLNLFTLATSTSYLANSWVVAIRLSCFEQSKLNELYTYRLLKRSCFFNTWYSYEYNPLELPNALIQSIVPSDYKNIHYEGYIQARINYATEWKRYWIVISSKHCNNGNNGSVSSIAEIQSVAKKFLKKKVKHNKNENNSLYSQISSSASSLEGTDGNNGYKNNAGNIFFYEDKKDVKKNKVVMEVANAFQVYGVWPEKPEIVEAGAGGVLKIEGEVIAASGKMQAQLENRSSASFVLFMLPTLKELVKCLICTLGTFQLSPAGLAGKSKQQILSSISLSDRNNLIIDPTYISKVDTQSIGNQLMGNPGEDDSTNIGIFSKNYNSKPIDDNSDELDIRTWGLLYLSLPEVHNININGLSNILTKIKYSQILALKRDARLSLKLQSFRDEVEESIRCKCIKERKEIEKKISGIKKSSAAKDANHSKSEATESITTDNDKKIKSQDPSPINIDKNTMIPLLDIGETTPIALEKEINKTFNSEAIVKENPLPIDVSGQQATVEETKDENESDDDKPLAQMSPMSGRYKKSPNSVNNPIVSPVNNANTPVVKSPVKSHEETNNNVESEERKAKFELESHTESDSQSESISDSESESDSDNELPVGMTIAATGIDVANLAKSPNLSVRTSDKHSTPENVTPSSTHTSGDQRSLVGSSAVAESPVIKSAVEKSETNKNILDEPLTVEIGEEVEEKKKKYTPSEFETLVMDAADAVAALSIDQFAEIKEEEENENNNNDDDDDDDDEGQIGMVEPPEMPTTPPPPGKQYALVAQPILSEDGEQVISWSYSYQLVDIEQYNMAQKLQEQADMESDEEEEDSDDDDDDDETDSDDIPLASARPQNNSESNEVGQIPMRDAINMFQNLDPTSEEFSKLLQSQRMSVLKGDSTLTPAELANLQLQLQQHSKDDNVNQQQTPPSSSFQLFAPNSLMAQKEKVNAQKKILEEQQQKIREEYGNVHTGPLLGTVNKDSKKPKLDGGLVGELDRRAREKEILKKMGLYKPPPPQEHLPSYLQKSGGVTSSHLSIQNPALLNRSSILMNPPQIINNPLMRPPIIQPPLIRNSIIQNPMMNFGQPGFYPPPAPGSFYQGGLPPPQSAIIPNPAVRHLDYEFDDAMNMHERDSLAKSWLEKEREKERQRQYERKVEHSIRMSKSFPSNINNLIKNYSDSDNEDEPLGNLTVSSKKKYKKSKDKLDSDSDSDTSSSSSETESSSESETESSSESETESSSESETETDSDNESDSKSKKKSKKFKKSKKSSSKKSLSKEKSTSNIEVDKSLSMDGSLTTSEKADKKNGKSSIGGEFEENQSKKGKHYSDDDSSDYSSSSEDNNSHRRNSKMTYSSHYSQPSSARHGHSGDYYYRRQPPQNVVNPYGTYVNNYNPNMYNRMYSSPGLGNVTPGGSRRYSYSESDDSYSGSNRHRRHRRDRNKRSKRHHRRRSSSISSYSDDSDSSYSSDYSRRRHRRHRRRDKDKSSRSGKSKSHKKKSSKKSHKKEEVNGEENSKIEVSSVSGLNTEILGELEEIFDKFIEECLEMKPKYQVTQDVLYNTFINWWNQQEIAKKAEGQQPSIKDLENMMIDNGFSLRPWKKSKHSEESPADGKDVWHNLKIKQ